MTVLRIATLGILIALAGIGGVLAASLMIADTATAGCSTDACDKKGE